jgi:hypothetical protein
MGYWRSETNWCAVHPEALDERIAFTHWKGSIIVEVSRGKNHDRYAQRIPDEDLSVAASGRLDYRVHRGPCPRGTGRRSDMGG